VIPSVSGPPLLWTIEAGIEPDGWIADPATQIKPPSWTLPVSVQLCALVDVQLMVNGWPTDTVEGLVEICAVGAGGGNTCKMIGAELAEICEPTPPLQVIDRT
jgi:hypothetical protein